MTAVYNACFFYEIIIYLKYVDTTGISSMK